MGSQKPNTGGNMKNAMTFIVSLIFAGNIFANNTFETIKKSFDATKLSSVQIETDSIDVDFTGENTKTAYVEVLRFEKNRCDLNIENDKTSLFIKIENKNKNFSNFLRFDKHCRAEIRIKVPKNTSLKIDAASADIKASGVSRADIHTASGDVSLAGVSKGAEIRTASGEINLINVLGGTNIRTASGEVRLARAIGDINISTASGDIDAELESSNVIISTASGDTEISGLTNYFKYSSASGSLKAVWKKAVVKGKSYIKTVSGDIKLLFPRGSKISLIMHTLSGSVYVDDDLDYSSQDNFEIRGSTVSGDVYADFLD